MTQTLARPVPRRQSAPPRAVAPAWRAGLTAALWSACAGLVAFAVPVLVVWTADTRSGAGAAEALRTACQVWLVANGASLSLPQGTFGLVPLGLVAVPVCLLARAAAHVVRAVLPRRGRDVVLVAVTVAVPYVALVALVAVLSATPGVRAGLSRAVPAAAAVALAGALLGLARSDEGRRALLSTGPPMLWLHLRALGASVAALLAAGAALAGAVLAAHLTRTADLASAGSPGLVGGVALLLLGLAAVPNAVVWSAAWLAGPGFAVGTGTAVGPFAVHLGAVPALPLLAALPAGPPPGWLGGVALLCPVAAGLLAARVLAPAAAGGPLPVLCLRAIGTAAGCGGVVALLALVSGGPLGGSRLVAVGPSPWQAGLATAAAVVTGTLAGLLVARRRRPRR